MMNEKKMFRLVLNTTARCNFTLLIMKEKCLAIDIINIGRQKNFL